jgi:hypothetical protein
MRIRIRLLTLGVTVAAFGGPRVGAADGPRGDAALSYLALVDHEVDETYGTGASLSAAMRLWGPLAAVAEASLSARSVNSFSSGGGVFDTRYDSIRGGLRLGRSRGRVRPYGQVAAGPIRWRIRERLDPAGREGGGWESATHFSVAPGLGLDVSLSDSLAIRGAADLAFVSKRDNRFDKAYQQKVSSFRLGLAFRWGG